MRNHARTILPWLCAASVCAAAPFARAQVKTPPQFIGAKGCGKCHKSEGTGNQFDRWKASPHARAYETLATEAAREVGKKVGISGDPQTTPRCLACHTTGAGASKARFGEDFDVTQGVQCEACHGAGSGYARIDHMIMRPKAREAGLVEPNAAVCKRCHRAESPTFKGFEFASAVKKIAHPLAPK